MLQLIEELEAKLANTVNEKEQAELEVSISVLYFPLFHSPSSAKSVLSLWISL